ncbi:NAD(+)/NADH kinase [uncultured Gemmiger sp.]|uniref:NAD(+)/NADH kinase n=1 Tax=uncultured Gemmiger sp. TaxID=1623490 RepID=UPI0025EA142C|nr:NAD(+)/NADH kinase [uncultured Gemmiger sp.]
MTVYLDPNPTKDEELEITRQAAALLCNFGVRVLIADRYSDQPIRGAVYLPAVSGIQQADAVVTVGGDGTLLRAASKCVDAGKPLLGINLGRTGFLATCEVQQMENKLWRLARGDYQLEQRSLLKATCDSASWRTMAVNDIVLYGKSRQHPMDYIVTCDGVFVCRFRSDGVILATPTGSTAYSLSAGGPVLDVTAPVFVLNAICPHGIHIAPLVFSGKRRICITSAEENRDEVLVSADSLSSCILAPGNTVEVQIAERALPFIAFDSAEQFRAIENKLARR